MKVVGGTASQTLSKAVGEMPGFEMTAVEIKRFPDKECYVKVHDNLSGQDAALIATTYPDENIIEALLLQDAVRNAGAKSLTTVIPYLGYARQDKEFLSGEAVSAKVMAKYIGLNSDRIFTIDIHNISIMPDFGKPAENLTGMRAIGEFLVGEGVEAILSPDAGSKDRARIAAEAARCGWDFLEKTRIDGSTVEIKPKNLDVEGKCVAIVDDIIATGGTIINATGQLKTQGATRIIAACTHGLFTGGSIPKLQAACDKVISTDTLERETSVISMASVLADALIQQSD